MSPLAYEYAPRPDPRGQVGRLSVVLVHYRGGEDLRRCVASLLEQDVSDLELILVDNGARDDAVQRLTDPKSSPGRERVLRRLHMPRNLGFGGGCNAGLQAASGELLAIINPDAVLEPGCLSSLAGALADGADLAAPRLLLLDDPERLDNCGHGLYPDGLNWCRGRGQRAAGRFTEAEDLLLFSGAAALFRRAALVQAGAFDPAYFAYGEDADLSLRMGRLGLRCVYVPEAVIRHRVGGAGGRYSFRKVFRVERNRARVALTHLPRGWLLRSPLWTLRRHLAMARPRAFAEGLPAAWPPRARLLLPMVVGAAHLASVLDLPSSLRRRRALGRLVAAGGLDAESWERLLSSQRIGVEELLRPEARI